MIVTAHGSGRRKRVAMAAILAAGTACAGCAHEAAVIGAGPAPDRTKAAFAAARDRCPVTVVETPAVQRCMREQGWAYRLPWQ